MKGLNPQAQGETLGSHISPLEGYDYRHSLRAERGPSSFPYSVIE